MSDAIIVESAHAAPAQPSLTLPLPVQLWYKLADKAHLREKIEHMFDGAHLNVTEDRSVLHVALRAPRDYVRMALLCKVHWATARRCVSLWLSLSVKTVRISACCWMRQ